MKSEEIEAKKKLIKKSVMEIGEYFKRKPSDFVAAKYADALIGFHIEDLKAAFNHFLNDGEKMPLIKDIRRFLGSDQIALKSIRYDPDRDDRFPVGLMQIGFEVLRDKGPTDFLAYCNRVGMPRADRDRVTHKYRCAYRKIDIADEAERLVSGIFSRGG